MSRPCFALSVMLSCMVGPLLIIGNTHAQDTIVSPSHDPGECIVCPLAHGPLEPCGGYSDYDYNNYWYEDYSPPSSEATTPADPELEVAQSLTDAATENAWESDCEDYSADYYDDYVYGDDTTNTDAEESCLDETADLEVAQSLTDDAKAEAWESEYDDYYADYVYGDDTTNTDAEEATLEETPAPAALIESVSEAASAPEAPQGEEYTELYDDYGWYTDADGDYFESYDNYDPIEAVAPSPYEAASAEATTAETAIDYEGYEEEWFSHGSETTVDAQEVEVDADADEAYEALTEAESEAYSDEIVDAPTADETWGDEEAWYREEYGFDGAFDEELEEACPEVEAAEQFDTGYDDAYDEAMATDSEVAEPAADVLPANPSVESPEADDYESFYDAYDDLYNFESTPAGSFDAAESSEAETSEATVEQAVNAEPAWLTELVDRMLAPVWTAAEGIASDASMPDRESRTSSYVDECAQEWDCESDYWAQPKPEQPSVVLTAADTLDGMAAVLQNAARFLRGVTTGSLAETAQVSSDAPPR